MRKMASKFKERTASAPWHGGRGRGYEKDKKKGGLEAKKGKERPLIRNNNKTEKEVEIYIMNADFKMEKTQGFRGQVGVGTSPTSRQAMCRRELGGIDGVSGAASGGK